MGCRHDLNLNMSLRHNTNNARRLILSPHVHIHQFKDDRTNHNEQSGLLMLTTTAAHQQVAEVSRCTGGTQINKLDVYTIIIISLTDGTVSEFLSILLTRGGVYPPKACSDLRDQTGVFLHPLPGFGQPYGGSVRIFRF